MMDQRFVETTCSVCHSRYKVPREYSGKRGTCKNCGNSFTMTPAAVRTDYPVIGMLAVKYKFIEEKTLREILTSFDSANRGAELEKFLVEKGHLSQNQMDLLQAVHSYLKTRQRDRQFGNIAVEQAFCTRQQIDQALDLQERDFQENKAITRIEDILIKNGVLSSDQRDSIVRCQLEREKKQPQETPLVEPQEVIDDIQIAEDPFELVVSKDGLSAHVRCTGKFNETMTSGDLLAFISAKGITHGIIEKTAIDKYLSSKTRPNETLKIAEGTPPVLGIDTVIRFSFDVTPDTPGDDSTDSSAENIRRECPPPVQAGDLIAEKIPGKPGQAGMDVFGKPLPPPEVVERNLTWGQGTKVSETGLKVYASTEGYPYVAMNGEISVLSELHIAGDLDHHIGDICFGGPIIVDGTIKSGFRVTGGSLTAKEIQGAEIVVKGDVKVSGGIIGARIEAKGDIHGVYVKNSNLVAYGDLVVQKEIINCDIKVGGECNIRNGKIISSSVAAFKGIVVKDVGTELSDPSRLMPGVDQHIEAEKDRINGILSEKKKYLEQLNTRCKKLEEEINKLNDKIIQLAQIQNRSRLEKHCLLKQIEEMKKDSDAQSLAEAKSLIIKHQNTEAAAEKSLNKLISDQEKLSNDLEAITKEAAITKTKVESLQQAAEELSRRLQNLKRLPVVKVFGCITDGTVLAGTRSSKTLTKTFRNVEFKEKNLNVSSSQDGWEIRVMREQVTEGVSND
ncbi:MAG: DUF342 domain-containing protein [Deltaproteobacteria bacterium]|nr:DUF342 domain-containing protein [Deltaproteobacteria bacterium]MBW1960102.1 DUF342 domain-containing protein [Deltaproteobacteria bacterium]MBW2153685.1 DUF342 domain-containing protein [Deltaproteobacteria bacterium]